MKKIILFLAAVVLLPFSVFCAEAAPGVTNTAQDAKEEVKAKYPYWLISPPIPGYSDNTSWSALLVGMILYMDGENDGSTYPSLAFSTLKYTLKNQIDALAEVNHYSKNNEWYLRAMAEYKKIPDNFYGIGNGNPASASEKYTLESMIGWLEFYKKITGFFHAGARFRIQKDNMVETKAGGLLDAGGITGSSGGLSTGLGILVKMDDRDNTMFVMKGDYHVLSAEFFGPTLAGNRSFELYTVDLRKYFQIAQNQTIGVRFYSENLAGHPPFNMLSLFGGSLKLRGFTLGRYRDMVSVFSNVEYKAILLDWLAVTGFAGLGDTAKQWGPEMVIKYSAGIGARLIIDKGNKTNLRLDFAYGKDGLAFVLDLNDNF